MDYTSLGNYVRERRQDIGLSQEQLAERVGGTYRQSDISRIERGHVSLPRLANLERLAASLDVPVGELLIAAGWFNEGRFTADPTGGDVPADLESAVNQIERELEAIQDMERELQQRTHDLQLAIRQLKSTVGTHQTLLVAD